MSCRRLTRDRAGEGRVHSTGHITRHVLVAHREGSHSHADAGKGAKIWVAAQMSNPLGMSGGLYMHAINAAKRAFVFYSALFDHN